MAAISDVAAHAGVSTATVSRHLGGQKVRAANAIDAAIAALNYTPSSVARSLKSGVRYAVAMIVPDVTNPFFASVVKGVEAASRPTPYNVFLYNTDEDPAREKQIMRAVVQDVDGIILAPTTEHDEAPTLARNAGVPLVFIDRTLALATFDGQLGGAELGGVDCVLVDNVGGATSAARHLIDLGHRRIAVIAGPLDTTPGRERFEGVLAECHRRRVKVPDEYRRISDFRQEGGYQQMLALLALATPPTAVVSCNNSMTIGALKALDDMRVAVPEELSIIGFDDLDLAPLLSPPLTVVYRDAAAQGSLAMRLLLKRLNGDKGIARAITLDTSLIVRGSCAPVGAAASGAVGATDVAAEQQQEEER